MHKLLLADDSVTIQRVIELTFSGEDIQVIAVNDGEQAIARIPIERPDIVLADIGMPKRSGYEVAAFVKSHAELAGIPVVLLAGAFERVDEARAEQVGCDGVLVKPFEPRQVVARVRELIAGSRERTSMAMEAPLSEGRTITAVAIDGTSVSPDTPSVPPKPPEVPRAEPAMEPASEAASSFLDPSLDDYFEKLNAALDDVQEPPPGSQPAEAATPTGRQSDSLDGYFDRLSAAFADLARPLRESEIPPPSFDELLTDKMPPAQVAGKPESGPAASWRTARDVGALDLPAYPPPPVAASSLPALTPTPVLPPEPTDAPSPAVSDAHDRASEEDVNGIADVLTALLTEPRRFDEPSGRMAVSGDAAASVMDREALVEEIARRVLDRLVPEVTASLRRLVADELEKIGTR